MDWVWGNIGDAEHDSLSLIDFCCLSFRDFNRGMKDGVARYPFLWGAYLFVSLLQSDVMARVKGVTSRRLRQEFKHLSHLLSLWTRSFFVSTAGNVSSDTIKRYVEAQKTRG
jgi:hypothetical protein